MAQMAQNNVRYKEGTFTGNGENIVSIDIGFEPDVLIISAGLDYHTAGWRGTCDIVFVKGRIIYSSNHSGSSQTNANVYANINVGQSYGDYGNSADAPLYYTYGTYNNGFMQVVNKESSPVASMIFINGQIYTWIAYKKGV